MPLDVQKFYQQLQPTPSQHITTINNKRVWIKRDDLNDSRIQGNKLRKLKYSLYHAQQNNVALLSFGGAHSNHIRALASAGKRFDIPTCGIIRGEELSDVTRHKSTLIQASADNMQLHFVSRSDYRRKEQSKYVIDVIQAGNYFVIPEGGSNALAIAGVSEVIDEIVADKSVPLPSVMFCACGTGGTLAGLLHGITKHRLSIEMIGVSALKGGDFLYHDVDRLNPDNYAQKWSIMLDKHCGGYAKTNIELIDFMVQFKEKYPIPIEPIYTGKLCKAVFEYAYENDDSADWLIYHSGGLFAHEQSLCNEII